MLRLNPYLSFNGQCEAAFRYYEKCLGGKVVFMMTYGDSPMAEQTPLNERNKIMHTTLALGDQVLAGADSLTEHYQKPQGLSVALNLDDAAEAERIFKALLENGAVQVPLQETFWAKRFGALVDQFGTPWVINCEKPS
jgi:PhnB protein